MREDAKGRVTEGKGVWGVGDKDKSKRRHELYQGSSSLVPRLPSPGYLLTCATAFKYASNRPM